MARSSGSKDAAAAARKNERKKKPSAIAVDSDPGELPDTGEQPADRYVVLARRHRPVQFEQVIGQEHVTRTLQNAIRSNRVHHAYLFTGSRGVGKTTVARIMAKALNCEQGPTPTPCDTCGACRESNSAVDVFEIDGASHTGVDDIRELRENVRYLPAQARNKIYIIDEVHMLSNSAFNALLKTLEEPPPHVVFIFATTEPHKIPATILSRCQRFDFKRVQVPALVAHLQRVIAQEGLAIEDEGLTLIARAAEGSVRDALSLVDQVIAYASDLDGPLTAGRVAEVLGMPDRRVLFELSGAVLGRDAATALGVVDRLFVQGQDLSQLAQAFLAHLRDLVVVRSCTDPAPLLEATEAELAELRSQAAGDNAALLQQHFDRFARAAEEIARSSYPRLLLEMALVEMVAAEPLLPLGDLLARLEQLEGRIARPPTGSGPPSSGGGFSRPASATHRGGSAAGPRTARDVRGGSNGRPERSAGGDADAHTHTSTATTLSSAPPGPATPRQQPAGQAAALARWQALLQRVEAEQPALASAYVPGRLVCWTDSDGDHIELAYPAGSFELARAEDHEKRAALTAACAQLLRRRVAISIRGLRAEEEASPEMVQMSVAQQQARLRSERVQQLRQEAETHPVTQALQQRFGARIQQISTHLHGSEDPP